MANGCTFDEHGCPTFQHSDGKLWDVPENFQLPKPVRLDTGWKLWIGGQPGSETIDAEGLRRASPIYPFQLLKMLPKTVKTKLEVGWGPIYRMMEMGIEGRNGL